MSAAEKAAEGVTAAATGAIASLIVDYLQGEKSIEAHPVLSQVPATTRLRLANLQLALRVSKGGESQR